MNVFRGIRFITRVESLHEPLKPVALVALGEGEFTVVGQEGLEGHCTEMGCNIYSFVQSQKRKCREYSCIIIGHSNGHQS